MKKTFMFNADDHERAKANQPASQFQEKSLLAFVQSVSEASTENLRSAQLERVFVFVVVQVVIFFQFSNEVLLLVIFRFFSCGHGFIYFLPFRMHRCPSSTFCCIDLPSVDEGVIRLFAPCSKGWVAG